MRWLILTQMLVATSSGAAEGWEVSVLGGWTAPTYEARLSYEPNIDLPDFSGARIRQSGVLALDARGSFAFGGSVAYYFQDFLAIEGRIDTVDFDIQTEGPVFTADVALPAPLPDATAVLDLGTGTVDVERLYPLSLNVKARTGGRARFVASGGVSYLPELRLNAIQ
ncbi:MAG TPA: hypothetical protein VLK65_26990, partial [Vicinamibacteria bacterium]|nr:hypothetical protein [Vicinamibacteria bacterium]